MKRFLRFVGVIARRDFLAVVATPTFIIFLMGPLFMLLLGVLGGSSATSVATSNQKAARIAAIASPADSEALNASDTRLRAMLGRGASAPALEIFAPQGAGQEQAEQVMGNQGADYFAVLYGPLDHPTIRHEANSAREAKWLARIADDVTRDRKAGLAVAAPLSKAEMVAVKAGRPGVGAQQTAGYAAVFVIFLLTTILASQAVGMLAEEKSNKVIEILAAAAPLEAVFLGKLLGMLGVATLFVSFWATLISIGVAFNPTMTEIVNSVTPAVGMPMFVLLSALYLVMSFLLMSAVLIGLGGLAATIRELQMMSLPVTLVQVGMFVLASKASGAPGTSLARMAEIIPLSSPMAMAARASTDATLWPHLLALVWQAVWLSLIIWLMARLFRFGVLKSGTLKQFFGIRAKA